MTDPELKDELRTLIRSWDWARQSLRDAHMARDKASSLERDLVGRLIGLMETLGLDRVVFDGKVYWRDAADREGRLRCQDVTVL